MELIEFTDNLAFNYFLTLHVYYTFMMFVPLALFSLFKN